jgi:hypothetical protein
MVGPFKRDGDLGDPEPSAHLLVPADVAAESAVRPPDLSRTWRPGLSPAGDQREVDRLMPFYEKGRRRAASRPASPPRSRRCCRALLHLPHRARREARPGGATTASPTSRWPRACRSSCGAPRPTGRCSTWRRSGKLGDPKVLERRPAACWPTPAAEALGTRFAAQWLRLQDVDKVNPDPNFYPNFDENLADMMRRETVMFFNHLVQRRSRALLDLYSADYTFMNERLAQHYGIPGWRATTSARSVSDAAGAGCSDRAACWCRPRWPTAPRRCCAASG